MLISPRFKEVINDLVLDSVKYYDAKISHNSNNKNYYILFLLRAFDLINYKNSEFVVTDFLGEYKKDLKFTSLEEYKAFDDLEIGELLVGKKIALKKEVDLFSFPYLDIFFSERLKNKVEEAELTGMIFNESSIEFSL